MIWNLIAEKRQRLYVRCLLKGCHKTTERTGSCYLFRPAASGRVARYSLYDFANGFFASLIEKPVFELLQQVVKLIYQIDKIFVREFLQRQHALNSSVSRYDVSIRAVWRFHDNNIAWGRAFVTSCAWNGPDTIANS